MTVLVTGATGFLGQALCRALAARGVRAVPLGSRDADLTRAGSLDPFAAQPFDVIYHLAAWTQAGDFCLRHPGEQWLVNQKIHTNVLDFWREHQSAAKLVSIGTSCAYDPSLPLVEDNYLAGTPIDSLFTYAMTKRMLWAGQLALGRQFGLRHLAVVPSTLYGPGYHTDGRQMHFVFDLIRKILRGRHYGEDVVLWGDGHQRREIVHVDDFVDALLALADARANELVNVGAGGDHSIRDFARMICDRVGYPFDRVRFDTTRYVGARSKCLDVRRVDALLPGRRRTPLADGLAETIHWFERNLSRLAPPPVAAAADPESR